MLSIMYAKLKIKKNDIETEREKKKSKFCHMILSSLHILIYCDKQVN